MDFGAKNGTPKDAEGGPTARGWVEERGFGGWMPRLIDSGGATSLPLWDVSFSHALEDLLVF